MNNQLVNSLYEESVQETLKAMNITHLNEIPFGKGYEIVKVKFKAKLRNHIQGGK